MLIIKSFRFRRFFLNTVFQGLIAPTDMIMSETFRNKWRGVPEKRSINPATPPLICLGIGFKWDKVIAYRAELACTLLLGKAVLVR